MTTTTTITSNPTKPGWYVCEAGTFYGPYQTESEATEAAKLANAETDDEVGYEVWGDGSASVTFIA